MSTISSHLSQANSSPYKPIPMDQLYYKDLVVIFRDNTNLKGDYLNFQSRSCLNQIHNSGKIKILVLNLNSFDDIPTTLDHLTGNGNRIAMIWIIAHGTRNCIVLPNDRLDESNINRVISSLGNVKPQKNGTCSLVLASCNAGKNPDLNFTRKIPEIPNPEAPKSEPEIPNPELKIPNPEPEVLDPELEIPIPLPGAPTEPADPNIAQIFAHRLPNMRIVAPSGKISKKTTFVVNKEFPQNPDLKVVFLETKTRNEITELYHYHSSSVAKKLNFQPLSEDEVEVLDVTPIIRTTPMEIDENSPREIDENSPREIDDKMLMEISSSSNSLISKEEGT